MPMLKKPKLPVFILVCYAMVFIWGSIAPVNRAVWFAENLPVVLVVILLVATYSRFQFSNTAYFLLGFFLCVHTIGGHYTFEHVPFDWGNQALSVLQLDFLFPPERNNFDRVGHFLVGVFAYPIAEYVLRTQKVYSIAYAITFGILCLGFWGAAYEVIEMVYAVTQGGSEGAAFLGSQGDIWDAQKDMLLDILGAMAVSVLFYFNWRHFKTKHN